MRAFAVIRQIALLLLPVLALASLIVDILLLAKPRVFFSVSANHFYIPSSEYGVPAVPSFCTALNIIISILTILLIVPGLCCPLFSTYRNERFVTVAWIEVCWVVVLFLLWLATAAITTLFSPVLNLSTANEYLPNGESVNCTGSCGAALAIVILAWINTLILLSYIIIVSGYISAQQHKRKTGVNIADDEPMIPHDPAPTTGIGDIRLQAFPLAYQNQPLPRRTFSVISDPNKPLPPTGTTWD